MCICAHLLPCLFTQREEFAHGRPACRYEGFEYLDVVPPRPTVHRSLNTNWLSVEKDQLFDMRSVKLEAHRPTDVVVVTGTFGGGQVCSAPLHRRCPSPRFAPNIAESDHSSCCKLNVGLPWS